MKLNLDIQTYLEQARKNNVPVREMMAHLGKSESTVQRYLNQFGLTKPADLDISAESVKAMYDAGMTCNAIAAELGISHDSVTKRLAVFGIKPDRAENIRKHFKATYDDRWPSAKQMLDDGMSFTEVYLAVKMRPEHLHDLIEKNGWHASDGSGYSTVLAVFDNMLVEPGINVKRRQAVLKYRNGLMNYYAIHKTVPTASQLSRFMGLSVQTVAWWLKQNGIMPYMGSAKYSYLLSAVLSKLDAMGVKYELNRRDLITPYEIDVWLYDYAAGIEVDPVTTHSPDMPRGKDDIYYHQKKSLAALHAGIPLCHVYDRDMPDLNDVVFWIDAVRCGMAHSGDVVKLDRFLHGAPATGRTSEPEMFWCNPNTGKCAQMQESTSYARVYTAGYLYV